MKGLLEVIAKSLVDNPDEVVVTEKETEKGLVLELKDKVKALGSQQAINVSNIGTETLSPEREAVEALVSLGFSASQSASAVAKLPDGLSVEEMVGAALKYLGNS